jgi:hypothetical protein
MMLEPVFYMRFLSTQDQTSLYLEFQKYGIGQDKLYKMQLRKLLDEGSLKDTPEHGEGSSDQKLQTTPSRLMQQSPFHFPTRTTAEQFTHQGLLGIVKTKEQFNGVPVTCPQEWSLTTAPFIRNGTRATHHGQEIDLHLKAD